MRLNKNEMINGLTNINRSRPQQVKETILDIITELIVYQDTEHRVLWANRAAGESVDLDPELLEGRYCYEVWHGRDKPCSNCPVQKAVQTGKPQEQEIQSPGNRFWYIRGYPVLNAQGEITGAIEVAMDSTDRKRAEEELRRTNQELKAYNEELIGKIASGIAHEIRNPMTTVRGFLQMLRDKEGCSRYGNYFNTMIAELDRANSIITEFLSLAKTRAADLKSQNLNLIVEKMFPLLQADAMNAGKYINLELGDIPDLLLDEKEIRQLILNLACNGLEAMPSGGILTLTTFTKGEEVVLAIRDQGEGVNPEIIEKLGTPFLTTKDNGTGLGLAICFGIAARHNASIEVKTGSTGSTFMVHFKTNK